MIAKTFDRQTAKFLAVVGENMPKLSGDILQEWIQNPRGVQKVLKEAFCPPDATSELKVWKTIKLGTTGLKTAEDFRRALCDGGFKLSNWANDILGKPAFTAAAEETEMDLVKVTVVELGFKKDARRDQIYKRAKNLGLELCPPEVGPQLRLQYRDQPNGEWILVAMKPIIDSGYDPRVFDMARNDSGLWLGSDWSKPDFFWRPSNQWVFCRPRK